MQIFGVELKMNIPNALSLLRILLVPVFAILYLNSKDNDVLLYASFGVLAISGITDLLDGVIARKLDQITELGKLLDPVADKLTQLVVVICLATRMPEIFPLLIICVVKEVCQAIGGLLLLYRGSQIDGAKWFGKVSTFLFYGAMIILLFWKNIPQTAMFALIGTVGLWMLFSFIRYMMMFFNIKRDMPEKSSYKDKLKADDDESSESSENSENSENSSSSSSSKNL